MAIQEEDFSTTNTPTKKSSKDGSAANPKVSEKNEEGFENALRPKRFSDYVGQKNVKKNLEVFASAAKSRKEPLDHILLYGPPGLGKTTLAGILSEEMEANFRITSGPAIEKPGDLAAILTNLQPNDLLFIDEIHRLRLPVEEILYTAMEDFAIDLIIGKGPSARTMRMNIQPFTLVGATTKLSQLSGPLRDRFGHIEKLEYYENQEIQSILERSAGILDISAKEEVFQTLSSRSRRTPRIANRLLRRVRDFAEVENSKIITPKILETALESLQIDAKGFDKADQEYLKILAEKFNGGPVGLSTISAATGEDSSTLEEAIEPFLIREGMLERTPKGRKLTSLGLEYAGIKISKPNQLF